MKETSTKVETTTTISKETSEAITLVNGTKSTSATTTSSTSSQSATNWTAAQQAQLERALQTYPPNCGNVDRWDKIAAEVEDKTKKECKLRVKVRKII